MATRKSTAQKRDEIKQRIAALKAQEQALAARESQDQRKRDTRRKILAGAAALAHADLDPAFAASLRTALDAVLTKDSDRELFKEWLAPASSSPALSSASEQNNPPQAPAPSTTMQFPNLVSETPDAA